MPSRAARSGTGRAACLRAGGRLGGGPTGPAHPLDLLDATITTIAAPTISSSLHGGPGLIKWLGASYALALGVLLVTAGLILGLVFFATVAGLLYAVSLFLQRGPATARSGPR